MTQTSEPLLSIWTDGLSIKEKEEFSKDLKVAATHPVLKRLLKIIKRERDLLERKERSIESYNIACWPYKQADYNGSLRTINLVETLLNFVER